MPLTPERREKAFKESVTYQDFVDSAQVNQADFLANFAAYQLSESDLAFFSSLEEPVDVLVLAHDWCGDVVANTPLFGLIEQATGKLRLHLLLRDPDNVDIAAQYPHSDGRNHIPTYIFYNQKGAELGVFIERPAEITAHLTNWRTAFFDAHPEFEGRNQGIGDLAQEVKKELLSYIKENRRGVREQEQTAIIEIIKNIVRQPVLAEALP
jgi:hypothetical protein